MREASLVSIPPLYRCFASGGTVSATVLLDWLKQPGV
jgi:hypothetical protein